MKVNCGMKMLTEPSLWQVSTTKNVSVNSTFYQTEAVVAGGKQVLQKSINISLKMRTCGHPVYKHITILPRMKHTDAFSSCIKIRTRDSLLGKLENFP